MQSMVFQVSAKTARLIGRENISDVDGTIIELVKNGYDADAECVYIKYIIPYNEIPKTLTFTEVKKYFKDNLELITENYSVEDGVYVLKEANKKQRQNLEQYLRAISTIIVLDNGSGMSREILESVWMNIGTDNKEVNIYSPKKRRIKTGAKGIGRFALDKLSLRTQVFTKCEREGVYKWEIDWTQFEEAKLLNQVEAKLEECDERFEKIVKQYLKEDFESVKNFDWATGTLVVLSPIREFWTEKLYARVNNNLRNINPLGNVDRFDVVVKNETHPELNCRSAKEGITRENYDYLIEAEFDGKGNVFMTLDRNEIDIMKKSIQIEYSTTDVETYDLSEFWEREAFKKAPYKREEFDGKQHFKYTLKELLGNVKEVTDQYNGIGPFSMKLYYLKNQKSTVEIVKDFKSRKRKQLLREFSGVKIYRDSFKIRPYGDEGQFFDWLNLSSRVQKSPAAASHESGDWRVGPNQVIGSVSISRIENPKLEDNANREGMNLNREYDCFVEIIQKIIEKFEYDRQYILREYAAWKRGKEKAHKDKVQQIYEEALRKQEARRESQKEQENTFSKDDRQEDKNQNDTFTQEELEDAIVILGKEQENRSSTEQIMMTLSAAGVMAQTFAHEITRIGTELGSRGGHLKGAIDRILRYEPYSGDEDFNPYYLIEELDSTDELLAEWVDLIMDSVKKENFKVEYIQLKIFLADIAKLWQPLLDRKYITIEPAEIDGDVMLSLPKVDLHLILNNFILNSAYYLEEADKERLISFHVYADEKKVHLEMKNNGPELDERYLQNPDETLNARISSKDDGTGLGLWIAREAVNRNAGELHVIPIKDGYMLKASWMK